MILIPNTFVITKTTDYNSELPCMHVMQLHKGQSKVVKKVSGLII